MCHTSMVMASTPAGMGFGKCHSAGPQLNDSGALTWYYNGGYEESWKEFEPTRGVYQFDNWNRWLGKMLKAYPNATVWLNVHTSQQDAVPEWAKQDPSLGYLDLGAGTNKSLFPIWNKDYQRAFEAFHTKLSEYIYSPTFTHRNRIGAVTMMAGGPWGEMIAQVCRPDPNYPMCQDLLRLGYTDEAYFDAMVNWLGPLYARLFPDYPMVLQAGGGAYGNGMAKRVAEALYAKYGTRIYLKQNGWSYTYADSPTGTDRFYISLFAELSDRMRVGFEPGRTPPKGSDFASTSDLVYRSIRKTMEDAPLSYFCLQTGTLNYLTNDQLRDLSNRFRGLQIAYPDFPKGSLPPAQQPSPTPQSSLPTNTPNYGEPTVAPTQGYYNPTQPTPALPYEVTVPPAEPTPTQSSWIAKMLTPQDPTPTMSFTNIPLVDRPKPTMKDMMCSPESLPRRAWIHIMGFPQTLFVMLTTLDKNIEMGVTNLFSSFKAGQ